MRSISGAKLLFTAFAGLTLFQPSITNAQTKDCSLALVLGIDASLSVDQSEYRLQMSGTAAALMDPMVMDAILTVDGMYLSAFEWSGSSSQKLIFDWIRLDTRQDIIEVAQTLSDHGRQSRHNSTAIGHALRFASDLLRDLPAPCFRKVIDLSGDGANNEGFEPKIAYRTFDFEGISVNGLVILDSGLNPESFYTDPVIYYGGEVLKGAGSFLIIAGGFSDFERAMRQKLLREILPGPVSANNL